MVPRRRLATHVQPLVGQLPNGEALERVGVHAAHEREAVSSLAARRDHPLWVVLMCAPPRLASPEVARVMTRGTRETLERTSTPPLALGPKPHAAVTLASQSLPGVKRKERRPCYPFLMRIAIVGAGGVGGLLGGLLARSGVEVVVVARGAALDAIFRDGLRVESPLGSFTAKVAAAAADPAALPPSDAVLVAVKSWQVSEVAPRLSTLVAPGGVVVPLQNGIEAADQLAQVLGPEPVAGGLIKVLAWIDRPGAVKHVGPPPAVIVGERGSRAGKGSPRLDALAATLSRASVEVRVAEDIEREVWEKFLLVEPWGAIAASSRAPIGVLRTMTDVRALLEAAMDEVVSLALARGVHLPADAAAKTLAFLDGLPPEGTASLQRDVGAGRPSELDDQVGAVCRLGRLERLKTPIHDALYAVLQPQEASARGRIPRFPRT